MPYSFEDILGSLRVNVAALQSHAEKHGETIGEYIAHTHSTYEANKLYMAFEQVNHSVEAVLPRERKGKHELP